MQYASGVGYVDLPSQGGRPERGRGWGDERAVLPQGMGSPLASYSRVIESIYKSVGPYILFRNDQR